MKRFIVFLVAGVMALAMQADATIINIPDDYPTIQEGIDASFDGDTVLVQPGTYVENVNFNGHSITLGSLFLTTGDPSFISSTIIDGNQSGTVVSFLDGEDNNAVITGFTLQNGNFTYGGGIYCYYSSPTITNNIISGNSASDGGGIYCRENANATINYNTISGNSAIEGGGILCFLSSPVVSNNTISGNSASDKGGGIFCVGYSPTITNNTISGNSASDKGGGIYCWYSSPPITNTIFWGNSAPVWPEIYLDYGSSPVITYCDVQGGWEGEGNIDADPLFHDPDNGDYHLQAIVCGDPEDSPCLGTGFEGADIGAFGIWCEIHDCVYIPGDCDHNGVPLELGDAVAMIGMYRGSVPPPYECSCPPHGDNFTPTADPNGNCIAFELGDVVTEIGAYRGSTTASGCEDCPGSGILIPSDDRDQPLVMPSLNAKAVRKASQ